MSDLTPRHIEQLKDTRHRLLVEVERLSMVPRVADVAHAIIKIESAIRGLDDAIRKAP